MTQHYSHSSLRGRDVFPATPSRRWGSTVLLVLIVVTGACQTSDLTGYPDSIADASIALAVPNGFLMNGLGGNGVAFNDINLNGIEANGKSLNGKSLNGWALNGTLLNGKSLNGKSLNGTLLNGKSLNGTSLNGKSLNGTSLNGKSLNDMTIAGEPVDAASQADALAIFRYLAECALETEQCITVWDLDDAPHAYCGSEGLDPSWASQEPDLTRSDEVAECFIERANAAGDTATHQPVDVANFMAILDYLVECALPAGDSATIYDENDDPVVLDGALGLAPGWRDGPPTEVEQRKVTACLAARSNALGKTVHISLRGAGIATDAVELDVFNTHEGAFMGDVFSENPYVNTCLVSGGGLSGRTCTQGKDCGFTSLGDCAQVCDAYDPVEGTYSDCAGEAAVVNSYLNLGDRTSFGEDHHCYVGDDRTVWCWGRNGAGQLGMGASGGVEPAPVQVTALDDVAEVVGGKKHSCARTRDGAAYCWGEGGNGRLGNGSGGDQPAPTAVVGLGSDVARISAFHLHSCAVKTDGTTWCWGGNGVGQLGIGGGSSQQTPVQLTALGDQVSKLSHGPLTKTTCAIEFDGDLWCWGDNDRGQVGNGTTDPQKSPILVAEDASGEPFGDVTDACSGASHSCARRSNGTVYCWGRDTKYQIGDGAEPTGGNRPRPVRTAFPGFAAPEGLSCGDDHTCAIRDDGALFCWGNNTVGELGTGTFDPVLAPTQVVALESRVARVSLASRYSCATLVDATLHCWGADSDDLLIPGPKQAEPVEVTYACDDDGTCEPEHAETCNTCASDCGSC